MLKKVFWLRKLEHGMHTLPANTVYSDHQVLVFSRGPYFFLVTNEANEGQKAQRVVWHNSTDLNNKSAKICDLLRDDPLEECHIIATGHFTRYHITGEPQLRVPVAVARQFVKKQQEQRELAENASKHNELEQERIPEDLTLLVPSQSMSPSSLPFHDRMGGLEINVNSAVVSNSGKAIQKLYAAAEWLVAFMATTVLVATRCRIARFSTVSAGMFWELLLNNIAMLAFGYEREAAALEA